MVVRTEDQDAVDALVTSLHPDIGAPPAVQTRDVILVTGPWLAGSTSLTGTLRQRLGDWAFVDAVELNDDDAPTAAVFVTPAVAPLTESDCALLDAAAANTDLVIGVVSKIDMYPGWREVLAANQAAVAAQNPRYANMVWVGVAAAPVTGAPRVDELIEALTEGLAHSQLPRRNRLRVWETRLGRAKRRHEVSAAGGGREARVAALRKDRSETLQRRRLVRSERNMALRGRIAEAKEQLTSFARNRSASVRAELGEDATRMTPGRRPDFENYVRKRVEDVVGEVHVGVGIRLRDLAADSGLTPPPDEPPPTAPSVSMPPPATTGWLSALMMPVGPILGLAVALAVTWFFPGLAPIYAATALVGGAAAGLGIAAVASRLRRLARDRAMLDRWVAEVIGELRAVLEQHVATRVLNAESALIVDQAQRDRTESSDVSGRIAMIDRELREHSVAAAQAKASRERELPALRRAMDAVRAELNGGPNGQLNGHSARNGEYDADNETNAENLNRSCE